LFNFDSKKEKNLESYNLKWLPLLFLTYLSLGQNFKTVDAYARSQFIEKDYTSLAVKLTSSFNDNRDKARAIFTWIATNINYDINQSIYKQQKETIGLVADRAFNQRKGVCMHYAMLFDAMCKAVGLESYYITGYTRDDLGNFQSEAHAWSAIVIEGKTFMIEPTWAAGYKENGKFISEFNDAFFLVDPTKFIYTHMPFDPMFQCVSNPLEHQVFIENKIDKDLLNSGNYNFIDTIRKHQFLPPLNKATAKFERCSSLQHFNNAIVIKELNYLEEDINYVKFDLSIDLSNKAVELINQVSTELNAQGKLDEKDLIEKLNQANYFLNGADDYLNPITTGNQTILDLLVKQRDKIFFLQENLNTKIAYLMK
jgi:hypothetical protein